MKKIVLFLALGLISFSSFSQQTNVAASDNAVQKTEETALKLKEEEFDFGKIPQGKPVHHAFELSNAGKEPLKIINVQASCGCTTPEWEKDASVNPGASTNINVGYNAAAEGAFNKTITITYNDNQTKVIHIKGEVWKAPATSAPENKALNELKN
jgi:hypothetical protein